MFFNNFILNLPTGIRIKNDVRDGINKNKVGRFTIAPAEPYCAQMKKLQV